MTQVKNVVLVSIGTIGDVNPFLALGENLLKQGYVVSFVTSDVHRKAIEDVGITFIGAIQTVGQYDMWLSDKITHNDKRSLESVVRHLMLGTMRSMFDIIAKFNVEDTLIIMHPLAIGTKIACDKYGFRSVVYCLQPLALFSIYDAPVYPGFEFLAFLPNVVRRLLMNAVNKFIINAQILPVINKFRAEKQLDPIQGNFRDWVFANHNKSVGLFPTWLKDTPRDWPSNFEAQGFVFLENNKHAELALNVKEFLENDVKIPIILVTLGSTNISCENDIEVTRLVIKKLGVKVIFLIPFHEKIMDKVQSNELFLTYTKHELLLPYVSVVVNNGGIGTCALSLAYGVPQLIIPKLFDQPDNAVNFVKLGVALKLSPKEYNLKNAFKAINTLMCSEPIRKQCKFYAKKINNAASIQNITEIVCAVS